MLLLAQISLFALLLTSTAASSHDANRLRSKRGLGHKRFFDAEGNEKRSDAQLSEREVHNTTLSKRSFTGRGTFYYVGLGACGTNSVDSDYLVALNSDQYGSGYPGPECFKSITIQSNGVTISGVPILDECPTCPYGGLDLSPSLFNQFNSADGGTLQLTWWFEGDSSTPTTTSTTQDQPTSTWTPDPTSTSTWSPPPSSTTSTTQWSAPASSSSTTPWTTSSAAPTTTSSAVSSSATSTSASFTSSAYSMNSTNPYAVVSDNGSASLSATASASASGSAGSGGVSAASGDDAQNLQAFNGLVAAYGQLIVVGAGGHAS